MARVLRKPDADSGTSGFCRDCRHDVPETAARCPACGSPRLLRHPSLFALSIAHVDCDAFYATIEKRDDPSLADKPVIVGGRQRGVVLTCCYVARTYGVRSAMPIFEARRLCPHAAYVPPEHGQICRASARAGARADERSHAAGRAGVDRRSVHGPLRHRAAARRAAGEDARRVRGARRARARHHGVDRAVLQQVPGQDRVRPRQAARLCGARARRGRRRSWRRVR